MISLPIALQLYSVREEMQADVKIMASVMKARAQWVVVEQDMPSMGKTPLVCAEMSLNYLASL